MSLRICLQLTWIADLKFSGEPFILEMSVAAESHVDLVTSTAGDMTTRPVATYPSQLRSVTWRNGTTHRADSRLVPSQWAAALLCNDASHWLGASLESTLNTWVLPWRHTIFDESDCWIFIQISLLSNIYHHYQNWSWFACKSWSKWAW